MKTPPSLDPASRNLSSSPEAVAAARFRELHPDERVLYTRLVRHGPEPVVAIAHGQSRPPQRSYYLVDIEALEARQLADDEARALLGDDLEGC